MWCVASARAIATVSRSWRSHCLGRRCRRRTAAPQPLSTSMINKQRKGTKESHPKLWVFLSTFSSMNLFISSMLGAFSPKPVYSATFLLQTACGGHGMLSENDNGVEILLCVLSSGRTHQRAPLLRIPVKSFPKQVADECVRGMSCSVSTHAYLNMRPWSPSPSSGSCQRGLHLHEPEHDAFVGFNAAQHERSNFSHFSLLRKTQEQTSPPRPGLSR